MSTGYGVIIAAADVFHVAPPTLIIVEPGAYAAPRDNEKNA